MSQKKEEKSERNKDQRKRYERQQGEGKVEMGTKKFGQWLIKEKGRQAAYSKSQKGTNLPDQPLFKSFYRKDQQNNPDQDVNEVHSALSGMPIK